MGDKKRERKESWMPATNRETMVRKEERKMADGD